MSRRQGASLIEVCWMGGIALLLAVPLLALGAQAVSTPDDVADRELVEGLCLDTIERLKSVAVDRRIAPAAMLGPVDPGVRHYTLFDQVYLRRIAALQASIVPRIERIPDPENPSLFRLSVAIEWRDRRGRRHVARETRWCFAAVDDDGA